MPRGRRKKQEIKNLNITVTTLIVISIVSAVLIYFKEGSWGNALSLALGGVLGFIKYFIPIGLFFMALYTAHEKDTKYYPKKIVMFVIILILIDATFSCYRISTGDINPNVTKEELLSRAYDLGSRDMGGGVLGTAIAGMLYKVIGLSATIITCVGVSIILAVFILGLHPEEAISNSLDKMEERKNARAKLKKDRRSVIQKNAVSQDIEVEPKETARERRLREKEERERAKNAKKEEQNLDEQITINLQDSPRYDHANDGLDVPNFSNARGINRLIKAKDYKITDGTDGNIGGQSNANSTNVNMGNKKSSREENAREQGDDGLFARKEVAKEAKTQEVLQLEHAMKEEEQHYEFPPIELLQVPENENEGNSRKALLATAEKLRKTLYSFGVSAKVENVSVGPAITRYELAPAEGVRVSKIANLSDDIALSLEAETIRIEAPIPGKHTVGIEVPNKSKSIVSLREIIESDAFKEGKSKLTFALGKDVAGECITTDIAKMPHLLIAGSTGSGKSVCINTMITSIIYKAKPSEVKLLMIDPKVVELSVYNGIPHLLIPVVTDPKKAAGALQWAVQEMVNRYSLFANKKVRDIKGYNELAEKEGELKLPQIVIIIDELADLMMVAAKEVEDAICRLAQMARAAGMHLVIATQRPSVDVITGIIKANIPSRIAFAVSSQVDSRTILDGAGAEKLLGKGDMLFYPSGAPKPTRIQGAFVSDKEVENIVKFIRKDGDMIYDTNIMEKIDKSTEPEQVSQNADDDDNQEDPLLEEAIDLVVETQQASTSFIQRRFKVGYARAGRIIDQMEERGIISGYQGSKPREVLMPKQRWQELKTMPKSQRMNAENVNQDLNEEENEQSES